MKDALALAKKAAVEAGNFLAENFGRIGEVVKKGDRNLATNLDKEAEEMIVSALRGGFPDYGILAEEKERFNLEAESVWIIDPLDGTHNFIRQIDIFGVSLGLWQKGKFVLGVVYMPKDKELYYAAKGLGAYKNGKKIKVSEVSFLGEASGSFDSSIRYSPDIMLKALGNLSQQAFNIRMLGSSVRQLSYLAEGKLDFAVEFHDRPWDFAGSVCIIEEAGGIFKSLRAEAPTPKTIGYVAANQRLYPKIAEIVSQVLK